MADFLDVCMLNVILNFHSFYSLRLFPHLLTLQRHLGLNSNYCPGRRTFKFTVLLNAFMTTQFTVIAAFEELKVYTLH
jgi:hypothetical protein